tara:strand:+ start:2782 stop:2976 length:195 start_codon:yes stop_codon:yes gene_type:complete
VVIQRKYANKVRNLFVHNKVTKPTGSTVRKAAIDKKQVAIQFNLSIFQLLHEPLRAALSLLFNL